MIDVQVIENLGREDYYLFPDLDSVSRKALDGIAVVRFKIKPEQGETPVNTDLEFPKLLESALSYFLDYFQIHALYVEGTPKKKSRLRSHKGMFYGLSKKVDPTAFYNEEFDLPNQQSLFLGLFRIEVTTLSLFLEHLIISSFTFGIITSSNTVARFGGEKEVLTRFFEQVIRPSKLAGIEYIHAIPLMTNLPAIAFRLTVDGHDNQYFECYGRRDFLLPNADLLIASLSEHFFLRGRQFAKN